MILYLLALATATVLCRYLIYLLHTRWCFRSVPGPSSSSWLWGQAWALYSSPPGEHYLAWHERFGKVLTFTGAFGHQHLSITDSRAIACILSDEIYNFPKPYGVRAWFKATLGEGIIWVEGKEAHESHRRLLAPALSQQSVRHFIEIFYENSHKLANQWIHILDASPWGREEIEVTNWAGRFALDTITRSTFSYDLNCLGGDSNALSETLDGLTNNENKASSFYMRALFWLFPAILRIGEKGRMIRDSKKELGIIASQMWRNAKTANDSDGRTLMSLMLKADASSNTGMKEEDIVDEMRTVISAGYETVSAVIAWTLYETARHPFLQAQLRDEISTGCEPSFDELNNNFPFLDAFLSEVIRLHPPVLENHHEAAKTMVIPLSEPIAGTSVSSVIVPKGTILAIPVNVMQMDPEIYGPDTHIFRPHRWLETSAPKSRDLFAFSEGPRSCIGRAFAMCEIKVLIITLLRQFAFECPHEIEAFQSFVVRPRVKGQGASSLPLLVRRLDA